MYQYYYAENFFTFITILLYSLSSTYVRLKFTVFLMCHKILLQYVHLRQVWPT